MMFSARSRASAKMMLFGGVKKFLHVAFKNLAWFPIHIFYKKKVGKKMRLERPKS